MKKYKIIGIISGSLITLGIVLILAGYANGGSLYQKAFGFYTKNGRFIGIDFNGNAQQHASKKTQSYSYTNVTDLTISMSAGKVEVLVDDDDTFRIDCINIPKNVVKQEQNGGQLHFKVEAERFNFVNPDYRIVVMIPEHAALTDLKISTDIGGIEANSLKAERMELSSDTGSIDVKDVKAGDLSLSNESGNMKIDSLKANTLKLKVDTGSADIKKLDSAILDVESDTGSVKMKGVNAKQITLDNDTGKIDCQIIGKQDEYGYVIENDMGKVHFGDQHFGINFNQADRNHGVNLITITNDVGSVDVSFTN